MKKNRDIKAELKEIAPILGSYDPIRKNDIKNDYFDNLQAQVFNELDNQEIDENNDLKTYFKELPVTVQAKVVRNRPAIFKYFSAIAAIMVIVFASVYIINQEISSTDIEQENSFVESLEDEDLIYLLEYLDYQTEFAMLIIEDSDNQDIGDEETEDMLEYLDESTLIEALEF